MPRVPDASSVTRLRAIQSSVVSDPVKKSASFVPAQPSLLTPFRASTQGQGLFPSRTVLSTSVVSPYIHSRHRGFLMGPPPAPPALPRITIDLNATDFNNESNPVFTYSFAAAPPATTFEAVLTNVVNSSYIGAVSLDDPELRTLLASSSITTSPTWTGSTLLAQDNTVLLFKVGLTPTFPADVVITFTDVPLVTGLDIVFESLYR
jgi:hypothetical protein